MEIVKIVNLGWVVYSLLFPGIFILTIVKAPYACMLLCQLGARFTISIFAYNFQIYSFFSLLEKTWHGFSRFTVEDPVYCEVR